MQTNFIDLYDYAINQKKLLEYECYKTGIWTPKNDNLNALLDNILFYLNFSWELGQAVIENKNQLRSGISWAKEIFPMLNYEDQNVLVQFQKIIITAQNLDAASKQENSHCDEIFNYNLDTKKYSNEHFSKENRETSPESSLNKDVISRKNTSKNIGKIKNNFTKNGIKSIVDKYYTEFADFRKSQIGGCNPDIRLKKILTYKLKKIFKRIAKPVSRKFQGRSLVAKNKLRYRGRFVKKKTLLLKRLSLK